jgi:hypothetical protein
MDLTTIFNIITVIFVACCAYTFLSKTSLSEETHCLLISSIHFTDPERLFHERYSNTAQDMMPDPDQIQFQAKPLHVPPPMHPQPPSIRQVPSYSHNMTNTFSMIINMSHDLAFDATRVPSCSTGSWDSA